MMASHCSRPARNALAASGYVGPGLTANIPAEKGGYSYAFLDYQYLVKEHNHARLPTCSALSLVPAGSLIIIGTGN
jgi:hypothetical protein